MAKTNSKVNTATSAALVPLGKGDLVSHLKAKALPYLSPWVGAYALPPVAGFATNEMWGQSALSSGLASAGLGIGTAVLSAVTWQVSGGTNKFRKARRAQATASVAAGMGWLTCATAAGPFGHPLLDLWLMGSGLFAASWNVRQIMRNAHDETELVEEKGGLSKLATAIGLEKVAVEDAKGNGKGTVSASIEVDGTKTIEDVQSAAGRLAAAMHVPPSGVTVKKDPDNAAMGVLSMRVADLLRDGVEFIPPVRLGGLPTEPVPVGLYADGETWLINPFDADILQHLLVMGVTGAGKSEFARGLLAHLMTRSKMSVFLVDLGKGRQSMGHISEGLDMFVTEKKEAKRLFKALPAAIKARADVLADEDLDQWTPASSLNAVAMWIEEAADVVDAGELEEIARKARSVGIWLIVSLQRATWTNLSTDIRANLQSTACFGVNEAGDAAFALPDSVTEAGAIPAWGSDRPGYAFATGMNIPQERWTTEVRSALTDRGYLAALVRAAAAYRDPLDEVTANALGLTYANRAHKGTNRTNTTVQAPAPVLAQAPAPVAIETVHGDDYESPEDEQAMEDEVNEAYADAYDEVMSLIPGDPEPDAAYAGIQLDDEVPEQDDDVMAFGAQERPGTEEARHILYTEIDGWARADRLEFSPADLAPAAVAAGRKRPWLQGELKRLTEAGFLQRDGHGSYTILHSPLQPA
ncbi:FtsK/SpoIIIE domain-containing protein [Streptomyces sp. 8L]|uniref:FtsK/SpoIIIE domain-containing protein n=1 Tax=Streptomyces sp. 8L TaxID=2877242 RepID=UPI001CD59958|nr:FtsK/SpoIIIE domain-containing protein [Streptomyces sp. 8L]MCA1222198.1 hypothetical protein [Streptomyces sp. 8L]